MFKTLIDAFKIKEVRNKLLLTLLLLFIYRLGCWLPIPGIDSDALGSKVGNNSFLSLLNSVSGGSLSQGSFLALGVSPYITSSIIVQLLAAVIPSWQRLAKEGADGRKKISLYTKVVALIIALAQSIGIAVGFGAAGQTSLYLFGGNEFVCYSFIVIMLVAGSMFTVWLGEKITEIGIGNGMSLLIFVGILSSAANSLLGSFKTLFTGDADARSAAIWSLILFLVALIAIFALVVFVDGGERRVGVQYAKQMKGRKMYGGQSTYIPVRVNANGVMPIIFASAILTFPQLLMSIFASSADPTTGFIGWWNRWLGAGTWLYGIVMSLLILAFAYFYTMLNFDTEEIARNIQQNGGFIPGIRPGKPTAQYLGSINKRITLFGAIFLAFMALIPTLAFTGIAQLGGIAQNGLLSAFSATGMLIVVSVALEFDKQLEAQMMMRNYRGFLK